MTLLAAFGKESGCHVRRNQTGSYSRVAGRDWPVDVVHEVVETGHRFRGVGRKLVAAGLQAPKLQFGLS